jgi:GDPmannose 4,6-dehydratase
MKKKVIITGIAGQDGSYLTKYLIKKNYKIFGILKKKKTK